ncbi:YgaP family membrane protein [Litoreibacter roseus]|uniref:Inner membrane protein YgaP-like transmembrane domain-containing protein n=1 Tax=Litoreibacter roseus TaxID=2601869 RepID=A0A6N6JFW2_9RHOB|nr:DUF2892 domain-containing protein [Litoreibacter roseus]GFE65116.1 hypothetical protein KIN_21900 [Litoreibacter roseus]
MQISRLFTYSFDPNVGPYDRIFRILSGLALVFFALAGPVAMPGWLVAALIVFGLAWLMTGALSRCGMYYMLGLSTRKG